MKYAWLVGVICVVTAVGVVGCRRDTEPTNGPAATDAVVLPAANTSSLADAVLTDLRQARQVDYLVIAADELVEAVESLVAHRRAGGLSVGVARMSDVRELGGIETLLSLADTIWPEPAPQYLLLAGDAASVPPVVKPGRFVVSTSFTGADRDIATDFDYARHYTRRDVVEDPGIPDWVKENTSLYDLCEPGQKESICWRKWSFLKRAYPRQKAAEEIIAYMEALPCVSRVDVLTSIREDMREIEVTVVSRDGKEQMGLDFYFPSETPANPLTRRVGRLPANSADELAVMVRKIIDYETTLPPGPWQRRVNFVASVGGFGQAIDRILEDQFGQIVAAMPPLYDTEIAYSAPTSNFCPYPPKFNDNAIDMFNRGCLFYVFIGHGSPTAVDTIRWQGQAYSILTNHDADRLDARTGPPVMIVLACSTGRFDHDSYDCLGETMLKAPGGPVAFIGGSRITQPYANVLLASAMAKHFFTATTIGDALTLAKADVLAHKSSAITLKADLAASLAQGAENLPLMRQDVAEHYNLLGDPAMKLRHPDSDMTLTVMPFEGRTGGLVEITAPGQSYVTLELLGLRMVRVAPTDTPEDESAAMARYRAANTYILHQTRVDLQDGHATFDLTDFPLRPSTDPRWLRATTETSAATVKLKPAGKGIP